MAGLQRDVVERHARVGQSIAFSQPLGRARCCLARDHHVAPEIGQDAGTQAADNHGVAQQADELIGAEVLGHDACGGGGGLGGAGFVEQGCGDQHALGLHALALLLGVVLGKCAGQAALLGMGCDGLHHADAAFQLVAGLVHRLAQAAALPVLHELGALLLAFQRSDFALDGVELGLRLGSQVAAVDAGQQGTGFGHLGGAGFADLMQLHRGHFQKRCPCNRRAGVDRQILLHTTKRCKKSMFQVKKNPLGAG